MNGCLPLASSEQIGARRPRTDHCPGILLGTARALTFRDPCAPCDCPRRHGATGMCTLR